MGRWQRLVVRWNLGHGRLISAGRLVFLLRIVHVRLLALQHFHVLADKVSNLEGLRRGQNHLRLFLIRAGNDHQTVHVGRERQYRLVVVRAERVARTVLEQMQTLLVDR